jgi:hypothetical protein
LRAAFLAALVLSLLLLARDVACAESAGSATRSVWEGPIARSVHVVSSVALGRGVRFNNPFRLETPLGDDAESLSLTAPYLDLLLGATLGPTDGLQHGLALDGSIAIEGIPQEVIAPSYLALLRLPPRAFLYGRAGVPVIIEPDFNAGLEASMGGALLASAGLGVTAELVASIFYGAATHERPVTTIPVLSLELGAWLSYELFP